MTVGTRRLPPFVAWLSGLLLLVACGVAIGVALGFLARHAWVFGLLSVVAGLGLGAAAVFAETLAARSFGAATVVAITIAILGSQTIVQAFEDATMRQTFQVDLARSRAADSGLDAAGLAQAFDADPEAAIAFFGRTAEALHDAEMMRLSGHDGVLGRLLVRSDGGLRLAAAGRRSWGLPLGRAGAWFGLLAEVVAGVWIALRVRRKARPQG